MLLNLYMSPRTLIKRFEIKLKNKCCCVRLQRYIWWKKSIDVWTKDHPFPIDIDYMITDTLELLRPKMRFSCSLDEATKQVVDLEREVLVKLGTGDTVCEMSAKGRRLEAACN